MFKTIKEDVSAEIVEKKSKFIANIFYIKSVEEAEEKIKNINKKYFDARHNCYAYSVFTEDGIVNRFSDNGEPSGTAGSPMLNIINSKELTHILVIVTRYFGGILLGTGGLVRAYSEATQKALENASEISMDIGVNSKIVTIYSDLEKLKYYLKQKDIEITKINYLENIEVYIDITKKLYENLIIDKENLNFKIIDIQKIEEKYIII